MSTWSFPYFPESFTRVLCLGRVVSVALLTERRTPATWDGCPAVAEKLSPTGLRGPEAGGEAAAVHWTHSMAAA